MTRFQRYLFGPVLPLLALCLSTPARATSVEIRDHRCVGAAVKAIHDSITDYDRYASLPGAAYEASIAGQSMTLVQMVLSQGRILSRSEAGTDAYAWVVLKPANLENTALYPRLMLRCTSEGLGENGFTHHCALDATQPHFGLDGFGSSLTVGRGAPLCAPSQSSLSYVIQLQSDSAQVEAIKAEVLRPAGVLAPLLGGFFNEELFFKNYYAGFYNGWISTL